MLINFKECLATYFMFCKTFFVMQDQSSTNDPKTMEAVKSFLVLAMNHQQYVSIVPKMFADWEKRHYHLGIEATAQPFAEIQLNVDFGTHNGH